MASPAIIRSQLRNGRPISPYLVRTHEFLNYYRFGFEPAAPGDLAITSQVGSCDLSGDVALQVAVQSSSLQGGRPPMNLTLVLDTSGSMEGKPIAMERAAIRALASTLQVGDVVSATTWNTAQLTILQAHPVTGPDDPALLALADSLLAGGGTDLDGGLRKGYELANAQRRPGLINRVVVVSDGIATVGETNEKLIGDNASDQDQEGIYLVGVGVGDGINDTLMDTVTDAGRGAYIFLDSEEEAVRMLHDRFTETILVAARDVQIELTLPPYFGVQKFFGEEYSPDPTKVRTQHLAPDDSMMVFQILRPCDPSLVKADDPFGVRVTWKDPVTNAPRVAVQQSTMGALNVDDGRLSKAAAIVGFTELLKALPTLSGTDRLEAVDFARSTLASAPGADDDPDLLELRELLELLPAS